MQRKLEFVPVKTKKMLIDFYENIHRMPVGKVFTTSDVMGDAKSMASANQLLGKLVESGVLCRAGKGRYYKPEMSEFGVVPLETRELVKDLLTKNGQPIAYISGLNALNELGLTTQVPADITIACENEKKAILRNQIRVRFIKQPNSITKNNIQLLRLLDCLRFIKKIPDNAVDGAFRRMLYLIGKLNDTQRGQLIRLTVKYSPQVRALIGAIMEQYYPNQDVTALQLSLNGLTKYKLGICDELLPNKTKWNIV